MCGAPDKEEPAAVIHEGDNCHLGKAGGNGDEKKMNSTDIWGVE